jgi:hypothetical protein
VGGSRLGLRKVQLLWPLQSSPRGMQQLCYLQAFKTEETGRLSVIVAAAAAAGAAQPAQAAQAEPCTPVAEPAAGGAGAGAGAGAGLGAAAATCRASGVVVMLAAELR